MTKKNELELTPFGLRLALAAGASAVALTAGAAWAQDDDNRPSGVVANDDVELIEEDDEDEVSTDDEIVVTGSRIKRSTFNSISPLQVITAEDSLDVGLIDPATILQQSEAAAGQQIDSSFQGFVLDNGPGSETLNLRGLGASRTLILINGRRMAPAGVEGAPTQPSINLLPGSLVERYDLLLDGASSIYGSDAVAGVGNVVLKKDFDGLELFASGDYAQAGAGNDYTLSAAWGANNDRGFFGVGVEYRYVDEVKYRDRDFLSGCNTHYEITEDGDIRTADASFYVTEENTNGLVSLPSSPCKSQGIAGRFIERGSPAFGSTYLATGNTAVSYPGLGYSESTTFSVPVDADGDGFQDVYFPFFSINGNDTEQSLLAEQKQWSLMSYGEYTFEGEMNVTPFFEALYFNRDVASDSGAAQLFPYTRADSPFNPCNPAAPGGVDCGLAEDALLTNPNYLAAFQAYYANPRFNESGGLIGGDDNCFGVPLAFCTPATFGLLNGPVGAIQTQPVVSVAGDRDNVDVTLEQLRGTAGVRADLPFLNVGTLSDWSAEASLTYSRGEGTSSRRGIRDDRLALALGYDPTIDDDNNGITDDVATNDPGTLVELAGGACDTSSVANPNLLTPEVTNGCVPVNLFAPSLFVGVQGDFATQAERDYLFDSRDFDTVYEQTLFNAYVAGTVAELPAGALAASLGVEYRVDSIDSQPDDIAANGLFFGFFSDLGAEGEKWTREAFGEVEVPLLGGKPLAREVTVNASARWTEDEFYGSAWTYSVKGGWRPVDSLLLKASYGTSFRAPNLRENFIRGQSGFTTVFDPCAVPDAAIIAQPGGGGILNPQLDTRNPNVIQRCIDEGRDPFAIGFDQVGGQSFQFSNIEISTGGTDDIGPETSESFTAGFAFEQPFFDSFDLNLNLNFYDIVIEDSIIEPSGQFLINQCFNPEGLDSPFCDRLIFSDLSSPDRGLVTFINASFVNQAQETVSGLDYNARFAKDFELFDEPMTLRINLRANQLKERSEKFIGDDGSVQADRDEGQFGFAEWTGFMQSSLDVGDYQFTWASRYIGEVGPDVDAVNEFSDVFGSPNNGFFGDTCGGPLVGDVLCRDVDSADAYTIHSASVRYSGDTMVIRAGVQNVFDTAPPKIDTAQVFGISNTPIGAGYDLNGRQFFVSVSKDF